MPACDQPAEHGFVAVLFNRVEDGLGSQAQRYFPAYLHELVLAAQLGLAVALQSVQIRLAHHGRGNARLVIGARQHAHGEHFGRTGISARRRYFFNFPLGHGGHERAVMRGMRHGASEGLEINRRWRCRAGRRLRQGAGQRRPLKQSGGQSGRADSTGGAQQLTSCECHFFFLGINPRHDARPLPKTSIEPGPV